MRNAKIKFVSPFMMFASIIGLISVIEFSDELGLRFAVKI